MVSKDNGDSRQRILKAAEAEFAAKGFDGARVDEIAVRAGVNKALIYYYFSGKSGLLETLTSEFLDGLRASKEKVPKPQSVQDLRAYGEAMVQAFLEYTRERLDLVRLVILEQLKGGAHGDLLIQAWRTEWTRSIQGFVEAGWMQAPRPGQDVFNFFFEDLALMMFLLVNPRWSAAMGRDPGESERLFLETLMRQSDAYYASTPRSLSESSHESERL